MKPKQLHHLLSESQIQKQILDYLKLKKYFMHRQNTGASVIPYTDKYGREKKRFVRYGTPGQPDIVGCINGRYVGIEVKAHGKYQSPEQKAFQASLQEAGGLYILARSVDDVMEGLA